MYSIVYRYTETPRILSFLFFFVVLFSCSGTVSSHGHDDFLLCMSIQSNNYTTISNIIYTPKNSSYSSILNFSIQNRRFQTETTPKPLVIVTPVQESQIPPIINCAKENGMEIRVRSGGHDVEGLSHTSKVPFIILDLINLREISVDVEKKTAWVQAGATLGELYYRMVERSRTLGFPSGFCPTVGAGGHISGGGYGSLIRKYGLAADHVIDARIVDVNGEILDRNSMGEELFWAIRGGGGASFGVILAWKLQLVDVPETVTVFTVARTLEQNATDIIHRWQYIAPRLDKDLAIRPYFRTVNATEDGKRTVQVSFQTIYLGGVERLLALMQQSFPELGVRREDCTEMSWVESNLYGYGLPIQPLNVLLNRTQENLRYLKLKADYVQKPISKNGLRSIWRWFFEDEALVADMVWIPYGGIMDEVSESAIPFPHRAGNLYKILYLVTWDDEEASNREISWIRRLYDHMTPYVSKFPRAAYLNYRDLDIGVNNKNGHTSYAQASIWGVKYFKSNFKRLVRVKTKVDPTNFFKSEQSIPPRFEK